MNGSHLFVVAVLLTVVSMLPIRRAAFVYEDDLWIADGLSRDPLTRQLFRPRALTGATFFYTESPVSAHGLNVALHLITGAAVYSLALMLGLSSMAAACAGGMFLLHPLNSQAVLYVSGRADLIAALGAVLAAITAVQGWLGWAVVGCVLAVAGKETGFMAVPIVGWWAVLKHWRIPRLLAITGIGLAVLIAWRTMWGNDYIGASDRGPVAYALTQSAAVGGYLWRVVWPFRLSVIHDWDLVAQGQMIVGAYAVLSLMGLAWWTRRAWPTLSFGCAWIILALLPRFVVRIPELLHEHQLYLAMVGVCLVTGALIDRLSSWRSPTHTHEALPCH